MSIDKPVAMLTWLNLHLQLIRNTICVTLPCAAHQGHTPCVAAGWILPERADVGTQLDAS